MTYEELSKLRFRFSGHLSLDDMHTTTYVCVDDNRFAFCDRVPYKDGAPQGRATRHYLVDGKVCKSKKSLIKAIEKL